MTRAQYQKELEKLEREADKRGCCVIPARPLREPSKHQAPATKSRKHQTPKASKAPAPKARRK
jgi:hypothetical protein